MYVCRGEKYVEEKHAIEEKSGGEKRWGEGGEIYWRKKKKRSS